MFLEHQINIVGSCDTEDVMMLKIQLCITGINYIFLMYSNRKQLFDIVKIIHNITNKCSLGEHKRLSKT